MTIPLSSPEGDVMRELGFIGYGCVGSTQLVCFKRPPVWPATVWQSPVRYIWPQLSTESTGLARHGHASL